ncbi:superoxide dismutase [Gloeocapsa sp. PCC 73106]|uniref:superoxide dismutase n=1 Tax=Gloeocapsa sp. PCC 73106 TaxID=102232 RepID=UPI0002AD0279|nr:superoxide dismutase [Gloeocapsa sp. PCC 73106]ELR97270.1 superoxide dismutase [Gloeocapsa sp. PCC 73106]
MSLSRRQFLYSLAGTAALAAWSPLASANDGPFELPPLPYPYDALEPYIDEETMQFHHDKHHAAYIKNLNTAVNKYPELTSQDAESLLRSLNDLPADIRDTVRNNGGGHINHKMFWEIMSPNGEKVPQGKIGVAIAETFGSFEEFKAVFEKSGLSKFGSGWVWLVLDQNQQLQVISTANQDSPILTGMYPIMGNDVWEHAYYLNYRNNRAEYLSQWWNVVNWTEVDRRFSGAIA